MTFEEINDEFDQQIKNNKKYKVHKELFNLTLDFTIDDWRFIRTQKYWQTIEGLDYYDKKEYTLKCVKYYIKNFKT